MRQGGDRGRFSVSLDYTILVKAKVTDSNRQAIKKWVEELKNDIDRSAGAFNMWISSFKRGRGRNSWHSISTRKSKPPRRINGMDVYSSKGDNTGGVRTGGEYSEQEKLSSNEKPTDEVMFSSKYNEITQSTRKLYDSAKKGNPKSAFELLSHLLKEDDINKIRSFGNDVQLLPVIGAEGSSTNVLPRIIADHISGETGDGPLSHDNYRRNMGRVAKFRT